MQRAGRLRACAVEPRRISGEAPAIGRTIGAAGLAAGRTIGEARSDAGADESTSCDLVWYADDSPRWMFRPGRDD